MVHAGAPFVLHFLIGRLQDLNSFCSELFEVLLLLISYTGLSVSKTRTFEKHGKMWALLSTFPNYLINKRHCKIVQLHFKFKNYHMKDKLVHARAPLVLLFLIGRLQSPTSSCWKLFEALLFLINYTGLSVSKTRSSLQFICSSLLDPAILLQILKWASERQKLVLASTPLVLCFLIERLQNLPSSCWKLFQTLLSLITYTEWSVLEKRTFEKFGKK